MASKIKAKKHQSYVDDKIVDLQRFAYDVFVFSALKFQVPANCILRWEDRENDYGSSDFILSLSRVFLKYQITQRETSYRLFKSRYESSNLDSIEKIQKLLQQVLKLSMHNAEGCLLHEVLLTLSVINEMILFLYSVNYNLYLKELARFFLQFVSPRKRSFERAGGLTELYKIYSMPKFDSVDRFYNEFIPKYCFPYDDSIVLKCLEDIFHIKSKKYFKHLSAGLSEKEIYEYCDVMHKTVWRNSFHAVIDEQKFTGMPLEISEEDEASGDDIRENPGLGIPQHEELLRNVGIPIPSDTTTENLPGPSHQEPARERKGSSQEKRERRKFRSHQSQSQKKD